MLKYDFFFPFLSFCEFFKNNQTPKKFISLPVLLETNKQTNKSKTRTHKTRIFRQHNDVTHLTGWPIFSISTIMLTISYSVNSLGSFGLLYKTGNETAPLFYSALTVASPHTLNKTQTPSHSLHALP